MRMILFDKMDSHNDHVNSVPNNAMMTTTVHLNHNFKENPVRGRHCDGVRDGFLCCS